MKRTATLAVVVAFVSVLAMLAAALTDAWLTDEVRVFALVMLPTASVASLLVLYFNWRRRVMHRVLAGHGLRDAKPSGGC